MEWNLGKSNGGAKTNLEGSAPVYGVGARFIVSGIGVGAEYENFDIDELDNAEMISISAFYQF